MSGGVKAGFFFRGGLIIIAGLGCFAGLRLSVLHLEQGEICPMIGIVPACIIVFLGYLAVLIAALGVKKTWATKVFYIGWTPVFLLAFFGVTLELTKGHICPPGPAGIPQCFFSLAMVVVCWGLFKKIHRA